MADEKLTPKQRRFCEEYLKSGNATEAAKKAGYKEMVLDTIIPLQSAIHLYKKVGFVEREAYYHNPMDDVLYFKKIL